MEDSKKTLKTLLLGIMVYAIVFVIIGFFLSRNKQSYFAGLLLGIGIAAGLAVHLYKSLDYCLELDPESAEKTMRKKAVTRYLIMVIAAGTAGCFPGILNPVGLLIGLMGLKISAYLQPFIHR